jgi:hypothetical protein
MLAVEDSTPAEDNPEVDMVLEGDILEGDILEGDILEGEPLEGGILGSEGVQSFVGDLTAEVASWGSCCSRHREEEAPLHLRLSRSSVRFSAGKEGYLLDVPIGVSCPWNFHSRRTIGCSWDPTERSILVDVRT